MAKQIFYDPQRKRWKRLRVLLDSLALAGFLLGIIFLVGAIRMKPLPELLLAAQKRNYRTLANQQSTKFQKLRRSAHRKTDLKPSDVPLNSGEGLRAAYYVADDPGSYSSLKQHISQIDILFPEWLHVVSPEGNLMAYTINNSPYRVVDKGNVKSVDRDNEVGTTIANSHVNLDLFPLVNNYDPIKTSSLPRSANF